MKFMVLLLALGYVVGTKGSLNELPVHPGVGGLYRGPNSETIIKGPDGSVITAEAVGGSIHTQGTLEPIVVADLDVQPGISVTPGVASLSVTPTADVSGVVVSALATPVVAAPAVVANALATATALPLTHTVEIVQPDPHIIETEFVDAPVVEPQQSSDLIGPSGSISTRGSTSVISGPASTTISEPARVLVAAPVVAAVPVVASVTTPLLAAPAAEVIADSVATASIASHPTISTVTVGTPINSAIPISTIASPTSWESEGISSSTIFPPVALSSGQLGGNVQSFGTIGEIGNIGQLAASVEPASSYGVINTLANPAQISSTIRPELLVSPAQFPPTIPSQELLPPPVSQVNSVIPTPNHNNLNQAVINNRQLNVNPSLIPSVNIIPPEIGPLTAGAINLGSTVTVSSTPGSSELYSPTESPNIQRSSEVNSVIVDNNIRNTDERLIYSDGRLGQLDENRQILIQNLVANPGRSVDIHGFSTHSESAGINVPLLRNTIPVQSGISQNGLIGAQLAKYGIDASQINLSNVPLSSVTSLESNSPLPLSHSIEDSSWNRYGRDVKTKKN